MTVALALVASCATELPTTIARDAVTMGAPDTADPATVALVAAPIACGDPVRVLCSGTLIAPRIVLTAAHCVTALPAADLLVSFGPDAASGVVVEVDRVIVHPTYAPPDDDVGLVVLAEPAPATIAPMPLRTTALAATDVGAHVRVAGYGLDDAGALGVKRTGTAAITQVDPRDFAIGAAPAMTCDGDSGGPVFVANANAIEEIAGITAFGDARCVLSGTNMRVDAYAESFIAPNATTDPAPRAAIDPSADFCATACADDADCPIGMGCVPDRAGGRACGLRGLAPGQLGDACSAGGECTSGMCLTVGASCRCYAPCTAPPAPGGGCTVASGTATARALLLAIAGGLLRRRRRR